MKIVDCKDKSCPIPVIMTKKEIEKNEDDAITTIVDNEVAKENVSKLANSLGYNFETKDISDKEFHIIIDLKDRKETKDDNEKFDNLTIAFSKDVMGEGDEELGKILVKSFMYTVSETKPYPKTIIFFNGGVNLTCEGSKVLEDLKKLEEEGVEIISCGTCLDFFNIKDKLQVGSISNMYTIYEKLKEPNKNIIL